MNWQPIIASALVVFSSVAMAEEVDFEVSAGLGHADAQFNSSVLREQLPESAVYTYDENDGSWYLNLSLALTAGLYGTVGYVDLGRSEINIQAETLEPAEFQQKYKQAGPRLGRGWLVGGYGSLWQYYDLKLMAAGGVLFHRDSIRSHLRGGELLISTETDTALYGGLGLGYQLTEQWRLSVDWHRYYIEVNDVDNISMGVSYRF